MKKTISIFVIVSSILLTSCGGSEPSTTIKVNMTDFAYNPNHFLVPAGHEITLEAINNGAVVHNLIVMNAGTSLGENFDEADEKNIYWKIELTPGQSTTTSFTAPSEPGEYLIVCSTAGHYEAGMTAKLVVVAESVNQ